MMNRHMEARMKQDRIYPPAHDRAGDENIWGLSL